MLQANSLLEYVRDRMVREHATTAKSDRDIESKNYGKYLYEFLKPKAVTTFYLEPYHCVHGVDDDTEILQPQDDRYKEVRAALFALPFPVVRVCRTLTGAIGKRFSKIETDVIVTNIEYKDQRHFVWAVRDIATLHDGSRITVFAPSKSTPIHEPGYDNLPRSFLDLIEILDDQRNRYIEHPISRQVRRAEGFSSEYREYIIIRKTKLQGGESPKPMTLGQIIRRHPMLHAVRGHLRHYRSGLVVAVRPHVRGKGEMLQVKDYITEEEYVSEA